MLYIVRILLIFIYFILVAAIGLLICLLRPFNPDNTTLIGRLYGWGGTRILGIRLEFSGTEHLTGLGPCVIIANHQHNLDLFVYGGLLPRRTVSLGKKSLRFIPVFGQMYWLAGNVLIDRNSKRQSQATMSAATVALRDKNTSLWIFPEGTRNRGHNLLKLKQGAFKTAREAQVPLVPVCASSYVQQLQLNRWRSATIKIRVLPPVSSARLAQEPLDSLRDDCWHRMMTCIGELDRSLGQEAPRRELEAANGRVTEAAKVEIPAD